jgi:hypothetical protein
VLEVARLIVNSEALGLVLSVLPLVGGNRDVCQVCEDFRAAACARIGDPGTGDPGTPDSGTPYVIPPLELCMVSPEARPANPRNPSMVSPEPQTLQPHPIE